MNEKKAFCAIRMAAAVAVLRRLWRSCGHAAIPIMAPNDYFIVRRIKPQEIFNGAPDKNGSPENARGWSWPMLRGKWYCEGKGKGGRTSVTNATIEGVVVAAV